MRDHFEIKSGHLWLRRAHEALYGTSIEIQVVRFIIDKIALKIVRAVLIEVTIEVAARSQNQVYFIEKQVLRSRLVKGLVLHAFTYSPDLALLATPPTPLHFQLATGILEYIASGPVTESRLSCQIRRPSSDELFYVEVHVINDDPIIEVSGEATQLLRVERGVRDGLLIGRVDIGKAIDMSGVEGNWNVTYRVIGEGSRVRLAPDTGLLFAGRHIDRLVSLEAVLVEISGQIGHRLVLVHLNVLVVVEESQRSEEASVVEYRQLNFTLKQRKVMSLK